MKRKIKQGLKELRDAGIRYNVSIRGSIEIDNRDLKKYVTLCMKDK